MSDRSGIEWTDATWSPVRGCTPVSAGCANCYAARMAHRFSGPGKPYEGLTRDGKWTGEVRLIPELLDQPIRWRKPRRIFVCSMSDLFHEAVPRSLIVSVLHTAALCWAFEKGHTFQILTKRSKRMLELLNDHELEGEITCLDYDGVSASAPWPLPNVHLGVSAENQEMLDRRVPDLLATPAAVRFVSLEPLLGEIDTRTWLNGWCPACGSDGWEGRFPRRNEGTGKPAGSHYCPHCGSNLPNFPTVQRGDYIFNALHWVIVGPETGPGARPCKIEWVRSIVEQCHNSDVPCFVKRVPGYSQDMATWPAWSQVREWPTTTSRTGEKTR